MKTSRNRSFFLDAAVAVLLTLALGAGSALAQSAVGTGSGSAGIGVSAAGTLTVPAGFTVIPAHDASTANDDIVQLEQLTIQSTSNSIPGTVYASRSIASPCREFMTPNGGGSIIPCPLAPDVLYQISVQSDTILLLNNRARASIGTFAVGDRINVYGFQDPGTSAVQALIMRDLDKPAAADRYVQLNGLTVVKAPGSMLPTSFSAARKGIEPCYSFASASAKAIVYPCPLGLDATASVGASAQSIAAPAPDLYRPFPFSQYYSVNVDSGTQIMDQLRRPIAIGNIQNGDVVNVYGRYNAASRIVQAVIVRDLSVPRIQDQGSIQVLYPNGGETLQRGSTVSIRWQQAANAPSIADIYLTAPGSCANLPIGACTVILQQYTIAKSAGQPLGNGLMAYAWTVPNILENAFLQGGSRYTLKVCYAGTSNCDTSDNVFSIVPEISAPLPTGTPSISSLSPTQGGTGTMVTLHGTGFSTTVTNSIYLGSNYVANMVSNDGSTLSFTVPQYLSPCPRDPYDLRKTADIMCPMYMIQLQPGTYPIFVRNANGTSNSVTFQVTSAGATF